MTVLQGRLTDRDAWSAMGECPIEKTMALLRRTSSAMLILREAFYGTTRFEDFCHRVGITRAAAAARLNELVDAGLEPTRRPYREPGQRAREEYVLTPAGVDFHARGLGDVRVGPTPPADPLPVAVRARGLRRRSDCRDPLRGGPPGARRRAGRACPQPMTLSW